MSNTTPTATTPTAMTAAPEKKKTLSCLGRTLIAFVDGGTFGAAIGGIISSAQALGSISAGTESVVGAFRTVARASAGSAASLGFALAGYSGGVCSLERMRGKRDFVNPFVIGGLMGAIGAVQRVEVHDGQAKRRVLAFSGRGLMTGSLSSALLCTVFWYMQQPSQKAREEREKQVLAQHEQQHQAMVREQQLRQQQRQRLAASPEAQKLMAQLQAGTADKEEVGKKLRLIAAKQAAEDAAAAAAAASMPPTTPATMAAAGGTASPLAMAEGDGSQVAAPPAWDPFAATSSATSPSAGAGELSLSDGQSPELESPAASQASAGFSPPQALEPSGGFTPGFASSEDLSPLDASLAADGMRVGEGPAEGGGSFGDGFKDPWAGK